MPSTTTTPLGPPPNKRRRISAASATATLSKPFRSPFRSSTIPPTSTNCTPSKPTTAVPPSSPSSLSFARYPSRTSTATGTTSISPTSAKSHLQALNRATTLLRSEIDTATQALKLETTDTDAELERLIDTWRRASREAAEVLYADVRERVNRMGGPGVWREMERRGKDGGGWWGADDEVGGRSRGGRGDGGDEREETEGEEREERGGDEEEGDDDAFTIDMMLKTLNVELDVIGFDKKAQRWID
ncbi:MAG: hypothetical protein M1816_006630 [Peltula sp. TS41687]|nr:MAG: hypothetical protein M1816_006630 [Peltula sp. TS41687]